LRYNSHGPEILVFDDLGDGFTHHDDAFAEDDKSKKTHALDHVRAFERDDAPITRYSDSE
jgi:hypothetical protein